MDFCGKLKLQKVLTHFVHNRFEWYIPLDSFYLMPQLAMHMIVTIVTEPKLDIDNLVQFIMTVRKSYRDNPYHNFEHAFNVCHCMYAILIRNTDKFSEVEVKQKLVRLELLDVLNNYFSEEVFDNCSSVSRCGPSRSYE